jgi:outer membrane protein
MSVSRQLLVNILLAAGLLGLCAIHFMQRPKLAYVDNARLLDSYKAMQEARSRYQKQTDSWQANLDTLKQTVQQEIDDYNRVKTTLPAPQRTTREARLAERQRQYFDYKKALAGKATTEESRLTGEVVRKADAFMRVYGKEHGYDIIFAATEAGTIVYGREGTDITDEVVKAINQ